MVHGITGNLAVWHLQIVPMLSDHFRVLTYDLRGHGYSDVPPSGYSPDAMAQDLLELLDALEIERPVIVGHSYGADIALYFAARHPERVAEVIAIESALPVLEDSRRGEDWVGWSYWAEALEQAGHAVPDGAAVRPALPDPRDDRPAQEVGAAEGPAAQPQAAAAAAGGDDAARGLPPGRHADLERIAVAADAGHADVRRAVGVPADVRVPLRAPARRPSGAAAPDRVGPLRAARAARGRRRRDRRAAARRRARAGRARTRGGD